MSENGKIINQAYEVLKRVYKEIYRLKDDIGDLLAEYDDTIKFYDEYSYSPNNLFLKPYHVFFFRQDLDPIKEGIPMRALVIICLFDEYRDMCRVNLRDEPELWVGLFDIFDEQKNCRAPWACSILSTNKRTYYDKKLKIGGDIFNYTFTRELDNDKKNGASWKGKLVGYPLVEITDREVIKEKILDKLFS
ncbi:MAG: hypothetical protein GXZ07_10070 [Firmicutes bacterium]|nr:hypothetical protein [Bacillota bacterium]